MSLDLDAQGANGGTEVRDAMRHGHATAWISVVIAHDSPAFDGEAKGNFTQVNLAASGQFTDQECIPVIYERTVPITLASTPQVMKLRGDIHEILDRLSHIKSEASSARSNTAKLRTH